MIIGQAPGAQEDAEKRPFVGRSGRLLDEILKKSGIKRQSAYITSVVQFYPPGNRLPTKEEIEFCKPFLERQIQIIKPSYILLLGNIASSALLGVSDISSNHGKIIKKEGIAFLLTFHPAAAIRSKTVKEEMQKDIKKFADFINGTKSTMGS